MTTSHSVDFAPSVYEHCARLIGRTPWAVSRDSTLLLEGQSAAYELYRHRPVVVGVDIYNLEAEAYGAVVEEPEGNGIPAIKRPVCPSLDAVRALQSVDLSGRGRIPMVIDVGRRLKVRWPDADVRIPVSGPFSIAANVMGFEELLCAALIDPEETGETLLALGRGQERFCRAVLQAGLDIAFFESAAAPPLLSPGMFRQIEFPALQATLQAAAAVAGHPVPCVIGGDTTPILPEILATGTRYVICPAETNQRAFLAALASHPEVMARVNMSPAITAGGTWDEIRAEVDRILALIGTRKAACLGTGALPYETPPENVLKIKEYVNKLGV